MIFEGDRTEGAGVPVPAPYLVCARIVEGSSGSKLHSAPRDRFRDVEFHGAGYSEH